MKQEQLKMLLQELMDKGLDLDKCAKILWQIRLYVESKRNLNILRQSKTADRDYISFHEQQTERARLQLDHYIVSYGIESVTISKLEP